MTAAAGRVRGHSLFLYACVRCALACAPARRARPPCGKSQRPPRGKSGFRREPRSDFRRHEKGVENPHPKTLVIKACHKSLKCASAGAYLKAADRVLLSAQIKEGDSSYGQEENRFHHRHRGVRRGVRHRVRPGHSLHARRGGLHLHRRGGMCGAGGSRTGNLSRGGAVERRLRRNGDLSFGRHRPAQNARGFSISRRAARFRARGNFFAGDE